MRLPECYPDEIIISRLIRFVTVTGISGSELVKQIFGSKRVSFHPFLPAGISSLSELVSEPPDKILYQETLASLFSFFLPVHSIKFIRYLLSNNCALAYRASQLPSFASGSNLKLKSCTLCVSEDIRNYGVSYWHRVHQVPGLTSCPKHGVLLNYITLKQRQKILPGLLPKAGVNPVQSTKVETKVAQFTKELLHCLNKPFLLGNYHFAYLHNLSARGFVTKNGRIKRKQIIQQFSEYTQDYRPSAGTPLMRSKVDYRYFSELLLPYTSHHPFRHLLFSSWLFDSPKDLLESSTSINGNHIKVSTKEKGNPTEKQEQQCLDLLRKSFSLNKIQKITGKSRCYLKRLALLNNIPIKLRPRKLSIDCINNVLRLARHGMSRKVIAKLCCIGIGSVEQIISSEPGLAEHRRHLRRESKRRQCKLSILNYKSLNPRAARKDFQRNCNQAYYWFYKNDRNWLEKVLPEPTKPSGHIKKH
ncbi:TnsD family Tn7-like transposition protein [Idiomarina sp. UBA4520]|uniref:TnsD family Tn7-like transposition protein n=1 Tax=Idiomarina sp. UBA4520 TaxID=1946647 RepID=UPI000C44C3C6|nr:MULTISPECIES: TnsD family Tn7-like transposition protein [unclassified Idiomarina]MBF38326.1 hypothetical protein [Idiomarinaceae bacterium]|tara:strand:- start:2302 stop:3723 length:1422 start_codon:yes stop_codon:yes gene_type:complete